MSTQHIGGGKHVSDALPEVEVESIMEYVVGASMLVSLSLIRRVGLMDEQLFLYFEELDWALRAGPGLTLGYARGSVVYHREGASSGINSDDARSLASFYYFSRNRKLIVEKFWPDKVPRLKRKMVIEVAVYMKRRQFRRARILGYILAGKAPPEFDRDRSSAS